MELQKPTKLADLFGHDLAGWQIAWCYFLELNHGLMGFFPAITGDGDGEIVVVLDKGLLQKVWSCISRRQAKVTSRMVVVNPSMGIAFDLRNDNKGEVKPQRIFASEEIDALCQKRSSFRWASGLISLSDKPIQDPVFT